MSVIGSLAVKHLKRSWNQALQVILVYLLCTCFFIAEGMTVYSYIQSAGEEKIDTFGEQSGFLSGCTAENVQALKQLDSVKKVGHPERCHSYNTGCRLWKSNHSGNSR